MSLLQQVYSFHAKTLVLYKISKQKRYANVLPAKSTSPCNASKICAEKICDWVSFGDFSRKSFVKLSVYKNLNKS